MNTQLTEIPADRGDRSAGPALATVARRLTWLLPATILSVSLADIALYEVAGVLDPDITAWPGAGVVQIIAANAVYLLVAAAALLALVRLSRAPVRWFAALATAGVVASLALPLAAGLGEGTASAPAPGLTTVIALSAMHLLSYAIAVPMLLRLGLTERA